MSIAIVMAAQDYVSQCAWYFVAFTFDTTLGVAIALGLHTGAVSAARRLTLDEPRSPVLVSIAECGSYGALGSAPLALTCLAEVHRSCLHS